MVNVGSNFEVSVEEIIKKISKILNKKYKIILERKRIRPVKSEVSRLRCNNTKIKKLTKWKPRYSFEQGLRILIKWLSKDHNLNKFKINKYNI